MVLVGLRKHLSNYFFLQKVYSTNIPSILKVLLEISLEEISCLTKTIIPLPNLFWFLQKRGVQPGILNCYSGIIIDPF